MNKKISIVISSFNEEDNLESFSVTLINELSAIQDYEFEILWVNDGSSDGTQTITNQIITGSNIHKNLTHKSLEFSKNFGHEAAMIAGIDHATGAAIICMDADGQNPPSEIPKMIELHNRGNEYVLMNRIKKEDGSFIKKQLSSLFYKFINLLSEISFQKNSSDFFLISDQIAELLKTHYREKNRFIRGFIQSTGFPYSILPYTAPNRGFGESRYSYGNLFKLALSAIFTFSFKPLRLSVFFAILFIVFTSSLSIYSIVQFFWGNIPPSGYTTIILFLSFAFSFLFSIMAIQLLYFEKLIEEVRQHPLYIIKKKNEE